MLAMSEDQLGHDNLFWDVDQSWTFPNLVTDDYWGKKSAEPSNNSDEQAAKDDESQQPSAVAKGKKSTAAAARKELDGGDQRYEGKISGGDQSDDHELHIWTERERRKKMRNMFDNLHSLLPHLPPKADKSTIVDEAVDYIKKLEQTLETLEKQKLERLHGIITININPINYDPLIITHQKLGIIQSREAFLAEQGSTASNYSAPVALPNPNPLFWGPNNNNYEEFPAIFKTWTSPNVILNVCGKDAQISICSMKKAAAGLLTKICSVLDKNKLEVVSAHVSSDHYRCMYMIHARANGGSDDKFQQAFAVEEIYKQAAAEIMLWVNS